MITGLGGGSGKTTVSLGLAAAWRNDGRRIAPFKKGPDFIDAGWLAGAAGQPCFNLDPFLMDERTILSSFVIRTQGAGCAVVEGNRGLYDGVDVKGSFSTAELAKQLVSPVILILDTTKMTRTAAALVLGCQTMDPKVLIAGVILNRVGRVRQEELVRAAIEKYCGIPVVGAIPRLKDHPFPERHMGLTPADEHEAVGHAIGVARETAEKYLDLDLIWKLASSAPLLSTDIVLEVPAGSRVGHPAEKLRIGVIRDSAFQFYYPENFEFLERGGAEIVPLSAVGDRDVPELDALYVGGGFPETHALALAENRSFREAMGRAVNSGLPVYAECGGLMYLGRSLRVQGKDYPMSGILPLDFELHKKPRGHGYTDIEVDTENPYFPVGTCLKGHEFHYSSARAFNPNSVSTAFKLHKGTGLGGGRDGVVSGTVLASYTHLHALGSPEWTRGLLARAEAFRSSRNRT